MSRGATPMTAELYEYTLGVTLREPPILSRLREHTATLGGIADMQISPDQGQFMALLARATGCRRYLEVGTFTGYSSLCMALAMGAEGRVTACDISKDYTDIARQFWAEARVADRIDLRLGPASETLASLHASTPPEEAFDIAFIDADKENYETYFNQCLDMVRPGGLIMVDNVLWHGAIIDSGAGDKGTIAMRSFNRQRHNDDRVDISLVPIGDGLLLARKRQDPHST